MRYKSDAVRTSCSACSRKIILFLFVFFSLLIPFNSFAEEVTTIPPTTESTTTAEETTEEETTVTEEITTSDIVNALNRQNLLLVGILFAVGAIFGNELLNKFSFWKW